MNQDWDFLYDFENLPFSKSNIHIDLDFDNPLLQEDRIKSDRNVSLDSNNLGCHFGQHRDDNFMPTNQ